MSNVRRSPRSPQKSPQRSPPKTPNRPSTSAAAAHFIEQRNERQLDLASPASTTTEDAYDLLVKGSSRATDFDSFTAAPLPRNRPMRTGSLYTPPPKPSLQQRSILRTSFPASTDNSRVPNRTEINRGQQKQLQERQQQQNPEQQQQQGRRSVSFAEQIEHHQDSSSSSSDDSNVNEPLALHADDDDNEYVADNTDNDNNTTRFGNRVSGNANQNYSVELQNWQRTITRAVSG